MPCMQKSWQKCPLIVPLVVVEYSFDDDEVISSCYTLWHRLVKSKRGFFLSLFPHIPHLLAYVFSLSHPNSITNWPCALHLLDDSSHVYIYRTQSTFSLFLSSPFPSTTRRLHANFRTDGWRNKTGNNGRSVEKSLWRMTVECAA